MFGHFFSNMWILQQITVLLIRTIWDNPLPFPKDSHHTQIQWWNRWLWVSRYWIIVWPKDYQRETHSRYIFFVLKLSMSWFWWDMVSWIFFGRAWNSPNQFSENLEIKPISTTDPKIGRSMFFFETSWHTQRVKLEGPFQDQRPATRNIHK